MEQLIAGFLIGVAVLIVVSLSAFLLYALLRILRQIQIAIVELHKVSEVFQKSADMSASMTGLVLVNRKMISSIESMTAAVRVFTSLVLKEEEPANESAANYPPAWAKRPPSPSMQMEEQGMVLSQTDEELAEIEQQEEIRQRNDVTEEQILAEQMPDQIKTNV